MTRVLLAVGALSFVAIVIQTSVMPGLDLGQVMPQLVLLVVVATGLARDAHTGMVAGFAAGLMLDLAPPADHSAGRWALALLLAGFVAGKVRESAFQVRPLLAMITVGVCSFVASGTYVLTGVVTDEAAPLQVSQLLLGVLLDLVFAPLVVPWVMQLIARLAGPRAPLMPVSGAPSP
ncbi:MAG: rod shape-determining protein MreD [Nocardioides sp.]